MYFGSPDVLEKGSTALHKDATSACNILVYAGASKVGQKLGAEWLIFSREDTKSLSEYLRIHAPRLGADGKDPCHAGQIYLDDNMLLGMKKAGIRPFRIHQLPGQAVFIPAGCAHQV